MQELAACQSLLLSTPGPIQRVRGGVDCFTLFYVSHFVRRMRGNSKVGGHVPGFRLSRLCGAFTKAVKGNKRDGSEPGLTCRVGGRKRTRTDRSHFEWIAPEYSESLFWLIAEYTSFVKMCCGRERGIEAIHRDLNFPRFVHTNYCFRYHLHTTDLYGFTSIDTKWKES